MNFELIKEKIRIKKEVGNLTSEFYQRFGISYEEYKKDSDSKGNPFDDYDKKILAGIIERKRGEFDSFDSNEKELLKDRFNRIRNFLKKKNEIEGELMFKNWFLMQKNKEYSNRNEVKDKVRSEISALKNELEDLGERGPDEFFTSHLLELRKWKRQLESGSLVRVPSVERKMEEIKDSLRANQPVFLHGHLGSGKSISAYGAARVFLAEKYINQEFEEWFNSVNKKASEEEIISKLKELNKKYRHNNNPEIQEKLRFYEMAGSKDMEAGDMYLSKSLKLEKINGKTVKEHGKALERLRDSWLEQNPKPESEEDRIEWEERRKQAFLDIRESYMNKYQAFGTVVEEVEGELLKAIQEGKPFVFDEVNAVSGEVLLSMNDLLTKKPGQMAFIPGRGQVEIQEGFAVIFTGNINYSLDSAYHGVSDLNAAFLSRLKSIFFDYPEQDLDKNFKNSHEGKNELFEIIIAKIMNRKGELSISANNLDKLHKLAVYAANTQRIFSGKWKESNVGEMNGVEPKLNESVLSVRAIDKILTEWAGGDVKDLEKAIWDGFISTATNIQDRVVLYKVAQQLGFFQESEGWKILADVSTDYEYPISLSDVRKEEYEYKKPPLEFIDSTEVVEILWGEAPEGEKSMSSVEDWVDRKSSLDEFKINFENEFKRIEKEFKNSCSGD